jgi:ABC-type dipeptide/oligopeptide/nickel transport systems, permease components
MLKRVFRQPLFLSGLIFIVLIFTASILYFIFGHDALPEKEFVFNRSGQLIAASPLSPQQAPPLGTDNRGFSLGTMILIGAKYTIGAAMIITVIRMFLSSLLGWLLGMYLDRIRSLISGLFDGIHYIPMTLLAAVILFPILRPDTMTEVYQYSQTMREVSEILILALIAVPVVMIQIANRIGDIRTRPFIESARVLGANSWQIFRREIWPHFLPQFSLIFVQQMIQVMVLLVDLGVLGLFFGGTLVEAGGKSFYSVTSEWSGLIGLYRDMYWAGHTWLFLVPTLAFTFTILSFSFILEGLKRAMAQYERIIGSANENGIEPTNRRVQDAETALNFQKVGKAD